MLFQEIKNTRNTEQSACQEKLSIGSCIFQEISSIHCNACDAKYREKPAKINQKLVQILNNLREQMYRYRLEYIKDADKRQILMVEHEHILKALTLRHIQEAKMAVREHIDNQEITILKNLKEQENDIQRKVSGRRN